MKGSQYERQTDKILTGGWNLLTSGDLISTTEALQMENCRVDSAGNLRSRLGNGAALFSPGGNVTELTTVRNAAGLIRYAATDAGELWRGDGTDLGSFGSQVAMVSYQGFLWAMSQSLQKKDDGTSGSLLAWTPAAPAAPVVTPTAGGSTIPLGLTYTYWVTYTDSNDQESPSSDGTSTGVIVVPNSLMVITSPTDPSDPQRTHWNLYRIGGTMENAFRVNTGILPLGLDFTDSFDPIDGLSDLQLTQLGIALDPDSEGPPAGSGLAGPYYERLLCWGVAAHPNRLYWSGTLQPYNFPGSSLDEGNHVDIGEQGEVIIGVTIRPRTATIYKQSSIWRLVGDPGDINSDIELVTAAIGAMSPPTSVGAIDYFESKEGLNSYDGETPTKISGKLDRLFRGEEPEASGITFSPVVGLALDPAVRASNRLGQHNGRLHFSYSATGATSPNRGLVCLLGADNWGSDTRALSAITDEGQQGFFLGSSGGDVFDLEDGELDTGTGIDMAYLSGYKDQGAPEQDKTYCDVVIQHNTGGADLTVTAYYNNGTSSEVLGTFDSTATTLTTLQLNVGGDHIGMVAKNVAIGITGQTTGNPILIYKLFVHWFAEPRDAKTFDSDETDLGTPMVKSFRELELDIDYPAGGGGTITWQFLTDRPGGVVVSRDSNTIAATTGREILRIVFASQWIGRLVRLTLRCDTTGSTFKLYGVRLRALPLGEYFDGAEIFTTEPVTVGIT